MGSNNIVMLNASGQRTGLQAPFTIEVGQGPTGIVMDGARDRLYVLNRFEASISVVSTVTETEVSRVSFFDPTPEVIKRGRPHFYDAHRTSGTGSVACAACHIDGKSDKMSWDLGDPSGSTKSLHAVINAGAGISGLADDLEDWHPVKGPMMTQTLQDVIDRINESSGSFAAAVNAAGSPSPRRSTSRSKTRCRSPGSGALRIA